MKAIPDDLVWKAIAPSERLKVLEFLQTQTRANYEKIRTWEGQYYGRSQQKLSPSFINNAFGDRAPKEAQQGLLQEFIGTTKFAIDLTGNRIYRDQSTSTMRFLTIAAREAVVIPKTKPVEARSIVTTENYIWLPTNERIITRSVLPDHPKARDKQAARRVPADKALGQSQGDLLEPREFFGLGSVTGKSFEDLNTYTISLKGQNGAENQKVAEQLQIDRADQGGQSWYRIRLPLSPEVTFTSVFSSAAGYNPVSAVFSADQAGEKISQVKRWEWKAVDGIFVPSVVTQAFRESPSDAVYKYEREVELRDCRLNKPLSPGQFGYQGLGLKEGDLVLDEIEKVVFIMEGGEPVKLANFGEKYVPPGETWISTRMLLIGGNILFLLLLIFFFVWRKRSRSTV